MFYTYAHYKPGTSEIFYIGKGSGNRLHKAQGRNSYWLRTVKKYNGFDAVVLQTWITEKAAFDHEIQLIEYYKKLNCGLTNLTTGGEGIVGLARTEAHKDKIRKSKLGKKRVKFSKQWLQNLSLATQGPKNPRAKKIKYNNHIFGCVKDLAEHLNQPTPTIYSRVQMNPEKWGYEVLE